MSAEYMQALDEVLEEFLDAYNGKVNQIFWQGMYKKHHGNSGESDSISGWINTFYPFLGEKSNHWSEVDFEEMKPRDGPSPESFPTIISTAPVTWNNVPKKFSAGVFGIKQDKKTLALSSVTSWIVTKENPLPSFMRPQRNSMW
jgi:hypothetical protein